MSVPKRMLFFQILSPAFSMILFLLCIGDLPRNMEVAVFNGETVEGSTSIGGQNPCNFDKISLEFLKAVNKTYPDDDPYIILVFISNFSFKTYFLIRNSILREIFSQLKPQTIRLKRETLLGPLLLMNTSVFTCAID